MTRDFDLRVSPRRLSVAGLYLRDHLRQRLQCRLICSTSHSTLIASRLFLSCFPVLVFLVSALAPVDYEPADAGGALRAQVEPPEVLETPEHNLSPSLHLIFAGGDPARVTRSAIKSNQSATPHRCLSVTVVIKTSPKHTVVIALPNLSVAAHGRPVPR